ncbi:hypothetical protein [Neolewinella agarilytica]|uniref:DUF4340 domain-containing protein n=1 Tax=Neolewinella agarilytica TaxID=478744 RepID=A0A1H9FLV1_9BACT|nr:hypothetical protein [Neolewinella agarilytica]SEQ38901.1 hypothetical protein SAMN05444359_10925 [Neolewinella agarilytica]
MRRLIPIVLFAVLIYVSWFYWQEYTDAPLREKLLLSAADELTQVRVTAPGQPHPFQLTRLEDKQWVVSRDNRQILDQSARAEDFVRALTELRTDSVVNSLPDQDFTTITLSSDEYGEEELRMYAGAGGPALARISSTGDIFALQPEAVTDVLPALSFDHFRGKELLHLAAASVDSIVATRNDSLLWRLGPTEAGEVAQTILAPASAPSYADHFDEIADRDKYHATLSFFTAGQPHTVTVFLDSLWPQPYVLVGEDFPNRFFGADKIVE